MALQLNPLALGGLQKAIRRTSSHGDISRVEQGGIEMFVTSSSGRIPSRILSTDSIASVSLRMRGPSRGFYAKPNRIVSSLQADAPCDQDTLSASASQTMQLVVRMPDILRIFVTTFSGQEYSLSMERNAGYRVIDVKHRLTEAGNDPCLLGQELTLLGRPLADGYLVDNLDRDITGQLHLFVQKNSRVRARPCPSGRMMDLHVSAVVEREEEVGKHISSNVDMEGSIPEIRLQERSLRKLMSDDVQTLLHNVELGLESGGLPRLTPDGSGGTYLMPDADGTVPVGVFKPTDEEPLAVNCPRGLGVSLSGEGLKKGTRVGEGAFREVAAYLLDHQLPGKIDSTSGYSAVPPTTLVRCRHRIFNYNKEDSEDWIMTGAQLGKLGSLQHFVTAVSNCEDMGPSRFPSEEVHKIAILDIRLSNTDRNGANILVQQSEEAPFLKLIPIDHGYCLPESIEDCTFEWLYWPQASVPFNQTALSYIEQLDVESDIALLKDNGWTLSLACARVFRISTMWLKKAAGRGLTAYDIGSFMVREDMDKPSPLENLVEEASMRVHDINSKEFLFCLSEMMDGVLQAHESR